MKNIVALVSLMKGINMNNIKIVATGKYLPKKVVTNDDLSMIVDTSDEWIFTRTGIKARRKAEVEDTVSLAYEAALDAITSSNYDKNLIDLIVVATITNEEKTPSVANLVLGKLGIEREIMTFDINAACTGFVYALEIASSMLNAGSYSAALVIGSEKLSSVLDYEDRNTCVLFGDGAGAAIIEKTQDLNQAFFLNKSRPDMNQVLTVGKHIKMDGKKVYQFAVEVLSNSITEILEKSQLSIDDIDVIIPHQANLRIIKSVSNSLEIPLERFLLNIEHYGNTSAASIPILLSEYQSTEKKIVLMIGFGGGFTYGAAILNLERKN